MSVAIVVPEGVLDILGRRFREGAPAALKWLEKPIPVCGGTSPLDWIRAGHTWDEVAAILEPRRVEIGA